MAEPLVTNPTPSQDGSDKANVPPQMDKPVTPPRSPQHEYPAGVAGGGGAPTDTRPPTNRKG
jgi:hypothetical protein